MAEDDGFVAVRAGGNHVHRHAAGLFDAVPIDIYVDADSDVPDSATRAAAAARADRAGGVPEGHGAGVTAPQGRRGA